MDGGEIESLLIVPEGIEMLGIAVEEIPYFLLIVPEGIEILFHYNLQCVNITFNRTRRN